MSAKNATFVCDTLSLRLEHIKRITIDAMADKGMRRRVSYNVTDSEGSLVCGSTVLKYDDVRKLKNWLDSHTGVLSPEADSFKYTWTAAQTPKAGETTHNTAGFDDLASRGDPAFNATIDEKLEELMTLAGQIGANQSFVKDAAPALRLIVTAIVHQAMREVERERSESLAKFMVSSNISIPFKAMPIEEALREGEKPFGYVVGHLGSDALACLQDVVSHADDVREALGEQRDRSKGGDDRSYWDHQLEVHERVVGQAKAALEIHKKVSS